MPLKSPRVPVSTDLRRIAEGIGIRARSRDSKGKAGQVPAAVRHSVTSWSTVAKQPARADAKSLTLPSCAIMKA